MTTIKEKLNELTRLYFKKNYDKNEYLRVLINDDEEIADLKAEILNLLYQEYDPDRFYIRVGCGMVFIDEIIEKTEHTMMTRQHGTIVSDNFSELPYAWVMGKKVSKKTMENIVKRWI